MTGRTPMKDFGIVLVAVAAWLHGASGLAAELTPQQSLEARKAIVAWLECKECTDGELDRLLNYGEVVVPTLGAVLERGPSPASLENYRLFLERTYQERAGHLHDAGEPPLELSEAEFVEAYLENYRSLYAVRSAQALAAFGGAEARKFLEAAAKRRMREDVDVIVQEAARKVAK